MIATKAVEAAALPRCRLSTVKTLLNTAILAKALVPQLLWMPTSADHGSAMAAAPTGAVGSQSVHEPLYLDSTCD